MESERPRVALAFEHYERRERLLTIVSGSDLLNPHRDCVFHRLQERTLNVSQIILIPNAGLKTKDILTDICLERVADSYLVPHVPSQ